MILTCPVCHRRFNRAPSGIRTESPACSFRCGRKQQGKYRKGKAPLAALAGMKRTHEARMQAVMKFHFGTLSARELDLFRHVWKLAYQRGYWKAWNGRRAGRRPATEAA